MSRLNLKRVWAFHLLACLAICQEVAAQTISAGTKEKVEQFQFALDLERFGLTYKDPLLLLSAARMKQTSGIRPSKAKLASTGEAPEPSLSVESLLVKARELAAGQPGLLAVIDDEPMPLYAKGTTIGPRAARLLLRANVTEPILLSYQAGQRGSFGVVSNRLEDLKLSIENAMGENICSPVNKGTELLCEWANIGYTEVRVRLTNSSPIANMLTFFHD